MADAKLMNADMVHRGNPFKWMMSQPLFWFEVIVMMIMPLPMGEHSDVFFGWKVITLHNVNWFDDNPNAPTGSAVLDIPYLTNDFLLAAMFSRLFFVL